MYGQMFDKIRPLSYQNRLSAFADRAGYENSLESYEALWIDPMQKALRPVSKRYPDRGFDLLPFCN